MRLLEFHSDPTLAPPAVLKRLKSHLGGRITRIGGPSRVYYIGNTTNKIGAIYVFEGTVKAFGMAWVKSPGGPKVKSFYVWNKFNINKTPDFELDIPEGISFPEVVDQVAHWLKVPSIGKELTEDEMLDEARRSTADEFMAMARRDMPEKVHELTLPDMMKIAANNDVQIPSDIRQNNNLKIDAHHWNLSGREAGLGQDLSGAATELGGELSSEPSVDPNDPIAASLNQIRKIGAVNKIASSGRLYLMGRNAKNQFFRIAGVDDMIAELERMHSRHIESLGGGSDRDGMEEQYDMLKEKVRLVAGGESAFIKSLLITGAPSSGKALALDTPIPTVNGWTTMGEIKEGDILYDENGQLCAVTYATPIQLNRKCYEIAFDDGTKIVADAEHRWLTHTQASRQSEHRQNKRWFEGALPLHPRGTDQSDKRILSGIVNTEEISNTLFAREKFNHRIDVCKPFIGSNEVLPISPYILGAWLGDGTASNATLSCGDDDISYMTYLLEQENQDYKIARESRGKNWIIRLSKGRGGKYKDKLVTKLRAIGVLNNKHIPINYLRSSKENRLSLLQGLMDTDGYISPRGHAEFTASNERLAYDFLDLVSGLGIKATISKRTPKSLGVEKKESFRIIFTTSENVFRFTRKLERINKNIHRKHSINSRTIISCEEIESVPVRCITVDSPSHLFLCSRSYIPTHNTFVVMQTIRELGLKAGRDYVVKKGHITTNSMYRTLIERVNGLVIFDDCDSVVEEKSAVNMLKGALDTDPVREISYDVRGGINTATMDDEEREVLVDAMSRILRNVPEYGDIDLFDKYIKRKPKPKPKSSEDGFDDAEDEDDEGEDKIHEIQKYITMHLPNKIDFKGRIIFISNMDEAEWDSAILTRAFTINMNFSSGEMLDYIDKIKSHIPAALSDEQKQEVLDWIRELYTMGKLKKSINFRLIQQAFDLRLTSNWKKLISML